MSDDVEARVLSVLFRAAGERYAIAAADVVKVAQCGHVCPAPRLPSCILGVTQLRGRIVTAFDVVTLLDGGARRVIDSEHAWLLLLDRGAKNLGLVADAVDEIVPAEAGRLVKARIDHARLTYVFGAAHALEFDAPDRVGTIAADFLERGESFLVRDETAARG